MLDVFQRRLRYQQGIGELVDRMLHQRGGCGVFGNVRAAFHGEADVGGGERGCIVDTVADHCHGFAGGFEFLHFGGLVARTHVTEGVGDAQLFGDVFDRALVVAVYCVPDSGFDEDALYRIAAAVEQNAAHPLARAIVSAAQARGLDIPTAQNAQTVVGAGITAEVEGVGLVKAGKAEFAELKLPENLSDDVWRIASIVAVSANGKPIGAFALADALKADTAEAIGRLKKHGIDVYIMSGDNQGTVEYVAKQLGIAHAFGNMSPRDKAAEVQKLKTAGKTVAMVGDGINDSPALAAANVSFAMKGGADVAEHTASATLMQHSVNQLADALLVSQATLKNIKQNLFFAFFYNILGIPLAALGFLNPVIAGAAMAASSVSVLSNALRLKRVKIE